MAIPKSSCVAYLVDRGSSESGVYDQVQEEQETAATSGGAHGRWWEMGTEAAGTMPAATNWVPIRGGGWTATSGRNCERKT